MSLSSELHGPVFQAVILCVFVKFTAALTPCEQATQDQGWSDVAELCNYNGDCVNNGSTYSCDCNPGKIGDHCESDDPFPCLTYGDPCLNGGTCYNTPPLCSYTMSCPTSQPLFYVCFCAPDFSGYHCETDLNANACDSSPCQNGGTCTTDPVHPELYTCSCTSAFTGINCQTDICNPNPCQNSGSCVVGGSGYTCGCTVGYIGSDCQIPESNCQPGNCVNGGVCEPIENGYICHCETGYDGTNCQNDIRNECSSNPCDNNGTCIDQVGYFQCLCPPLFNGIQCDVLDVTFPGGIGVNVTSAPPMTTMESSTASMASSTGITTHSATTTATIRSSATAKRTLAAEQPAETFTLAGSRTQTAKNTLTSVALTPTQGACRIIGCESKHGNGVCDEECNTHECSWDGMECSLGLLPWANCTVSSVKCWDVFEDGVCDDDCNVGMCMYDGFDCRSSLGPCSYDAYCNDFYHDGHCDNGCNTAECSWDGLDCVDYPPRYAEGTIVMTVLVEPEVIRNNAEAFLREIGHIMRAVVVFVEDGNGDYKILYWSEEETATNDNKAQVVKRSVTQLAKIDSHKIGRRETLTGSKVYLKVDNRQCYVTSGDCFENANQAASFLAARSSKGSLKTVQFPIHSVHVEEDSPPDEPSSNLIWIVGVVAVIVVIIPILGVLLSASRRRKARGKLWFPENFTFSLTKKRKADGQPDSGDDRDASLSMRKLEGIITNSTTASSPSHEPSEHVKKRIKFQDAQSPVTSSPSSIDAVLKSDDDTTDKSPWARPATHIPASFALTPPTDEGEDYSTRLALDMHGPDGVTPLMLAAQSDNGEDSDENGSRSAALVTDLLAQGACPSVATKRTGETPLHMAARYARADAAKSLLSSGSDCNAKDLTGRTPLHAAIAADANGVFQILLRNRATNLDAKTHDGTTALILAARLGIENTIEELIDAGADFNVVDSYGKTALHWAAAVNNFEAITFLLKHSANKDTQDDKGETALFLAAREGSYESAKILLDHYANREITDHMDRSPCDIAKHRLHNDIVRLLEEYNIGESPPALLALTATVKATDQLQATGSFMAANISISGSKKRKTPRPYMEYDNPSSPIHADLPLDDLILNVFGTNQNEANFQSDPPGVYQSAGAALPVERQLLQMPPAGFPHQLQMDAANALSLENPLISPFYPESSSVPDTYNGHAILCHSNTMDGNIPGNISHQLPTNINQFHDGSHNPSLPAHMTSSCSQNQPTGYSNSCGLDLDIGVTAPVSVPSEWMKAVNPASGTTSNIIPPEEHCEGYNGMSPESYNSNSPNVSVTSPECIADSQNGYFVSSPSQMAAFQALTQISQQPVQSTITDTQNDYHSESYDNACMFQNYSVACP
ncbi:neurogenic locus notch homolog protein 1-like [Ptychodera flava]|uniref:neurogenic locus notch homolog protein 1-like n=1 Tax=Ptychodera flava TaxID=63121 RepID=UPI00396A0A7C